MGRFAALLAAGLAGAVLATHVGCTSTVKLSQSTGFAGSAGSGTGGKGAHFGDGSIFDGSFDGSSSLGTGGATTCLGQTDGGAGVVVDAHPTSDAGVCPMLAADPPAFPWIFEPRRSTPGVDAGASGCQANIVSGQVVDVVCSGPAWLRASGGLMTDAGESVPSILWDDGSLLSWSVAGGNPSVPPPVAAGAAQQRVWVAMESHGWLTTPGQCGFFWNQTMELRDTDGGPIRFMARQGASLPELTADQSAALFGTTTQPVAACTHDMLGGPGLFHQTLNDHLLGTGTPARIVYAQPTRAVTPNGTFELLWYSRTQHAQALSTTCAGCLNQGPIVGLLASRVAP
jgi:hypothetical protein